MKICQSFNPLVAPAMPALNVPWSQWRAPRVANVIVSFCAAKHIVQDCIKLKWVNRPLHVEVSKDISSAHIPFPGFSSRHTHAPVSTFSQQWNDYKSDHLDPCPWTPDFLDLANNSILFYKNTHARVGKCSDTNQWCHSAQYSLHYHSTSFNAHHPQLITQSPQFNLGLSFCLFSLCPPHPKSKIIAKI